MSKEIKEGDVATYVDLEQAYTEAEASLKQEPAQVQISFIPLESSNLKGVQYIPGLELLLIVFKKGKVYCYSKVPQKIYQELVEALSKGEYFDAHIKGKFKYEYLGHLIEAKDGA